MKRYLRWEILLALVVSLMSVGMAIAFSQIAGRNDTGLSAAGPTRTPTSAVQLPAVPTPTATTTPTQSACIEPTAAPTATAEPTPSEGSNLLVNGDFADGFSGWTQINGYWRIHDIVGSSCDASNPDWPDYMAEMDRDNCSSCNTWPVGGEDWLSQEVVAPDAQGHTTVTLQVTEAHHMTSAATGGRAEITVYGSHDGQTWESVFFRAEPEAAWGAGHRCETPPTFTYAFAGGYGFYRVELHGALIDPNDGWIIGPLQLSVDTQG